MNIPWNLIAKSAPSIVGLAVDAVERLKKPGADKEAEAIALAKKGLPVFESASGIDINDASFDELLASYIRSRVALQNFVAKQTPPDVPPSA